MTKMPFHIVGSESEYWSLVGRLSGPREVFDAQGDLHGEVDMALVESIECLLVPIVGQWEQSEVWFHNLDFYGDGIRSLIFRDGDFPFQMIPRLYELLVGDAAAFCITVQLCDRLLGGEIKTIGALAIASKGIVATKSIQSQLVQYV